MNPNITKWQKWFHKCLLYYFNFFGEEKNDFSILIMWSFNFVLEVGYNCHGGTGIVTLLVRHVADVKVEGWGIVADVGATNIIFRSQCFSIKYKCIYFLKFYVTVHNLNADSPFYLVGFYNNLIYDSKLLLFEITKSYFNLIAPFDPY